MVRHYQGQNYSKLHKQATTSGQPFNDPLFPPTGASLGFSENQEIVWKRPGEICEDPKLVVDGVTDTDLNQGVLGNCWFVAACSCLASEKKLWEKVIPHWKQQEWDPQHPERYGGIFHFQFWRMGEWLDVVVDDYLPTKNGQLVFMRSTDKNEFWSALLEKAYAKLTGSYEALSGGQTGDALVDFTGGVNESINLREGGYSTDSDKKIGLFEAMEEAHKHRALISCSIAVEEGEEPEKVLDCGLIKGHAYAITNIRKISLSSSLLSSLRRSDNSVLMLRLRNPWGKKEWNGAWSDQSEEWKKVPDREREKLNLKVEDDGDFWMELQDWIRWFTNVSICRQVNTRLLSLQKTWYESTFHGQWRGRSAGGSINHPETFLHNPQYVFKVPHDGTQVMFSLMQKDPRGERGLDSEGGKNFPIGFYIMKVEENREYRLHALQEKAGSITFTNRRSVFGLFTLNAGCYIIVPSTFDPGMERDFLLRVFSERPHHAKELTKEQPNRGVAGYLCFCCWKKPQVLVTVHVEEARGLKKQDITGAGADPYCIVKCGRQNVETPVKKDTLSPAFNTKVNFYISNPASTQVTVQVWNYNVLVDSFMGQVQVNIPGNDDSRRYTENLMGRGRHSGEETQGTVTIRVVTAADLTST